MLVTIAQLDNLARLHQTMFAQRAIIVKLDLIVRPHVLVENINLAINRQVTLAKTALSSIIVIL